MSHDNPLIRQWLQDLGKAVVQAMADSEDVTSTVQRIQNQGFSLYLVLDAKESGEDAPRFDLTRSERQPEFRLDGEDVAFLKSLGIDASRTGKKKRS